MVHLHSHLEYKDANFYLLPEKQQLVSFQPGLKLTTSYRCLNVKIKPTDKEQF